MQSMPTRGAADEDQEMVRVVQLPIMQEVLSICRWGRKETGDQLSQLCKQGAKGQWRANMQEQELQTQMDRGEAARPREAAALLPAMPAQLMYKDGWINPIRFAVIAVKCPKETPLPVHQRTCQTFAVESMLLYQEKNLENATHEITGLFCAVQIFMVVPASIRLKLQLEY